ncbi:hypothetical protein [Bradyrhizobium jicamae]|uniref:hypothetical protein n=1 Tax=Bradyrhizobium jicamae TaxID=280332 RepID=UPI001BA9F212|nr:hypothetical protein [Bradyrhizobium jicamae]MBR0933023.1 hypothetical protein [Bradyrhizobium jicamae]
MLFFRVFLAAVSGFLACLYVYDACFGDGGILLPSAGTIVARRWADPDEFRPIVAAASPRPAETTPAARVRETFAMFMVGDGRGVLRPLASARPQG